MYLSFPIGSDRLEYTEAGETRKQEEIPWYSRRRPAYKQGSGK